MLLSSEENKMLNLENKSFSICYLAASRFTVETVRHEIKNPFLKEDEWRVRVLSSEPTIVKRLEADAVVEFASCGEDLSPIARFTRKFGPLVPWIDKQGVRGVETLARWTDMKYQFQETWDNLLDLEHRKPGASIFRDEYHALRADQHRIIAPLMPVDVAKECPASGTFSLTDSGLAFVGQSLYAALLVQLFSLASKGHLRRCQNPECSLLPYFLFSPDRKKFCSANCANYGKRQAKLAWWNTKGSERRQRQSQTTSAPVAKDNKKWLKGDGDGTQKAR
jgi:hypothetical protein